MHNCICLLSADFRYVKASRVICVITFIIISRIIIFVMLYLCSELKSLLE
uniref:Uncharacterized protein n=1 Tax=Octopus bimaculoides TaxID=37653 RepID=A0A0L8I0G1_OCTBM